MGLPRLLVLLGCAAVLATAASACGSGDAAAPDESTSDSSSPAPSSSSSDAATQVPGVSLTVNGQVGPEPAMRSGSPPVTRVTGAKSGLLITYTVRNTGSAEVLVVDRLPNRTATMRISDQPDPLRAVLRVGPGGQLDVVKTAQLGSAGLDYTPQVQASVVPPGATHQGRAFVSFPAGDYDRPNPFPSNATQWRFCVGVVPDASAFTARSSDGTVAMVPGSSSDAERLVCGESRPLPDGWA